MKFKILVYGLGLIAIGIIASCVDEDLLQGAEDQIDIISIDPNAGIPGTVVIINGENFDEAGDDSVFFNGSLAEMISVSSSQIRAVVPNNASTGPISVKNNERLAIGPDFIVIDTVSTPLISEILPDSGYIGDPVIINGSEFGTDLSETYVRFNQDTAVISLLRDTLIQTIVAPDATTGPVSVIKKGRIGTGPEFKVLFLPEIDSIAPTEGLPGVEFTIFGKHFSDNIDHNTVTINQIAAEITSATTTELKVIVPDNAVTGKVVVQVHEKTVEGPTFTVLIPPPTITTITPNSGPVGTEVTINGTNFSATANQNTVEFNGVTAAVTSATTTQINATVPANASTGTVSVTVNNQTVEGPTFTVTIPAPTITSINPNSGPVGTEVTINGTNFSATANQNTVEFNGVAAAVTSATTTQIKATVPANASTGTVSVTVNNQTVEGPTFTVTIPAPTITSINPNSGPVGTEVTINGTNFSATANQNTVEFNGVAAAVTSATTTQIKATVPANASTGTVSVTVNNQTVEGPTFTVTIPAPTITSINPTSGPAGTEITIIGTNFSATANQNTVEFNGVPANVTSATTTQIIATVPANATSGIVTVTVNNQTANGPVFTVTIPAPAITSISPTQGGFDTQVTINGSNFGNDANAVQVEFNGSQGTVISASDNEVIAVVPVGAGTGPVTISVSNQSDQGPTFTYLLTRVVYDYTGSGTMGFLDGTANVARFNRPVRAAINNGLELFVTDLDNHSIRFVNTKGAVSTLAGNGTAGVANGQGTQARFNRPSGITLDANGDFVITDFQNHAIRKVTPTGVVSTLAGFFQATLSDGPGQQAGFNNPADVVMDSKGNLFVADFGNHAIRKIDPNLNVTTFAGNGSSGFVNASGTSARFNFPIGIGIDQNDNLYVAEIGNHAIRKITPAGVVTTLAGDGTSGFINGNISGARFNQPYDVTADGAGNLFIPDFQNNVIRVIRNESTVETYAGNGTNGYLNGKATDAQFRNPSGFIYVNDQLQYVNDYFNHRIRVITLE